MKKISAIFLIAIVSLLWLFREHENHGDIVLVGGGPMPPGLFKWVLNHKPYGRFLLVSDDGIVGPKWDALFEAGDVAVIEPEELTTSMLDGTGAILIDGGHQFEYLSRIDSKVLQMAHENGILILGTSAGAMIMGEFYFTAKHGTVTSQEAESNPKDDRINIESDFLKIKFLKNTIVDSHFVERNREGRLQVFLDRGADRGLTKGIGIDESTALCIEKGEKVCVLGFGGVHFMSRSTQGSSRISWYQRGTSSRFDTFGYLDRNKP